MADRPDWPCGVPRPQSWWQDYWHGMDECEHPADHDGPHTWERDDSGSEVQS